jgi:hypothetical protein
VQDPHTQQVKTSAPMHLSLQELKYTMLIDRSVIHIASMGECKLSDGTTAKPTVKTERQEWRKS